MSDDLGFLHPPGAELVGRKLGQYTLERVIGQGGMATVYVASQENIERKVAVKVLPPQFMHQPAFLERFRREVQVIARLQHPRILPVFDYGQFEDRPFIVMAYMGGGTLQERIRRGPMPVGEVVRLVEQIAEGLDHAHRQGVIHRDFKPSNVLLDEHGNAYLADFGIAKISESTVQLTGSGIVGTPAYMAPEMADRGEVTASVDIYALGTTIYEMLTASLPYRGETPLRVMIAHAQDPIPSVRDKRPDVSPAVSSVVHRAMAKRPDQRYASAGELARALRAAFERNVVDTAPVDDPGGAHRLSDTGIEATRPEPISSGWTPAPQPSTVAPQPYSVTPPPTPAPEPKPGCPWGLWAGIGGGVLALTAVCAGILLLTGLAADLFGTGTQEPPTAEVVDLPTETPEPVEPTRTPEPPMPTRDAGANLALFQIVNRAAEPVCRLYVSPATKENWEDVDQVLGTSGRLAPGATFEYEVPPGQYDLRADDCSGQLMNTDFGLTMGPGQVVSWEIIDATDRVPDGTGIRLTIVNDSGTDLCYLYISPTTEQTWGPDELINDVIGRGTTYTLDVRPGLYDLRAETCDDLGIDQYNVNLNNPYQWVVTPPEQATAGIDRNENSSIKLRVINDSSYEICFLYLFAPGTEDFGPNELLGDTIPVGATYILGINPGIYNLRAETCDQVTFWEFASADMRSGFEWTLVD